MEYVNASEKLGLDLARLLRLGRAMSDDAEARRDLVRRLFCLITIAAEDAAATAVDGQSRSLSPDCARAAAASLGELGMAINRCLLEPVHTDRSAKLAQLVSEPGRYLVNNAFVLITSVVALKEAGKKRSAILDAGINVLGTPRASAVPNAVAPPGKRPVSHAR